MGQDALGPACRAFAGSRHRVRLRSACHESACQKDCLQSGMDVLIEKPMVMNGAEARRLIELRDKTKRLVMVAFPGSLSPAIWGECLFLRKANETEFKPVSYRPSRGPWQQFLRVRSGKMPNPCPPEIGLRFATLMDMIRQSGATGRTIASGVRGGPSRGGIAAAQG